MGMIWRFLWAAAVIALLVPAAFYTVGFLAPATVVSQVHKRILAAPDRVWPVVTDWRAITANADAATGLPHLFGREVVGGGQPAAGKILRYALGHGVFWDQRLTDWEPLRRYAFRNTTSGAGGLQPGDVEMAFALTSPHGGGTVVDCTMTVKSHGAFNKAVAFLFGKGLGTMVGYQTVILNDVASASTAS